MQRSKFISVVLLNYNHANFLERSIEAIISQSLKPYELIIADDASSDSSFKVIKKYVRKYKWITLKQNSRNLGVCENTNSSLDFIKSEYAIFAAADDFLQSDWIERSENHIQNNKNIGLVASPAYAYSAKDKKEYDFYSSLFIDFKVKRISPDKFENYVTKYGMFFKGATSVYNLNLFKKYGGYIKQLGSYADTVVAYRCGATGGCIFDPLPGASCERSSSGFASSSMRSLDSIEEIISYLLLIKEEISSFNYTLLVTPLITRLLWVSYSRQLLIKKDSIILNPPDLKTFSYIINIFIILSKKWEYPFFKKIFGFFMKKVNKFVFVKRNHKKLPF